MQTSQQKIKVSVCGKIIEGDRGENLRKFLLKHGIPLYNGNAQIINCRGLGSCGTCAVAIEGEVSEPNWKDKGRRSLPPHSPDRDLRLACQTTILGDIKVTKQQGFWGHQDKIQW